MATERISEILFSRAEIKARIDDLGKQLADEYRGKNPLVVGILKGAFVFMSDLVRAMDCPLEADFLGVKSYGAAQRSCGSPRIVKDLDEPIKDRHVILVEGIIDSGRSLFAIKELLLQREPASLKIVTLFDKSQSREADIEADISCFTVPDKFIVGFGLDYAERFRQLPYAAVLSLD